MADITIWQDKKAREAFIARGKEVYEKIRDELAGKEDVVAIHPESGDYFVGKTLGKADAAAYAKYPDQWVYFVRLDDPNAAMPLPTW
jgi:hypothetical protein